MTMTVNLATTKHMSGVSTYADYMYTVVCFCSTNVLTQTNHRPPHIPLSNLICKHSPEQVHIFLVNYTLLGCSGKWEICKSSKYHYKSLFLLPADWYFLCSFEDLFNAVPQNRTNFWISYFLSVTSHISDKPYVHCALLPAQ